MVLLEMWSSLPGPAALLSNLFVSTDRFCYFSVIQMSGVIPVFCSSQLSLYIFDSLNCYPTYQITLQNIDIMHCSTVTVLGVGLHMKQIFAFLVDSLHQLMPLTFRRLRANMFLQIFTIGSTLSSGEIKNQP